MAIYPGAAVRLLNPAFLVGNGMRMAAYNRINFHVAAGYGSLFNFFNQSGRASSHFWVAKSGLVEQYVDTNLRAEADLQGNDATISIETESKGEAWTEAQIQALVALAIWICDTHGIRKVIAQNSHLGEGSKGLSWHRMGIDGNFPSGRYGGRLQRGGGMYYSKATGKTCPVEPNIDLMYDRIGPAVSGGVTPVPNPIPVPTPTPPPPPKPTRPNCTELQRAVRTTADNAWGSITDKHCDAVREASNWGGNDFPYGKAFTQSVCGATPDGIFGPKSWAAHDATVRAVQQALHNMGFNAGPIDGIWGNTTEGAYQAARNACHI